jgi:hypothetical protein
MHSFWTRCFGLFAAILFLSYIASAQQVGTVQGTVSDPTGAVIPNARVTLNSVISGYRQTQTTDGSGQFKFANVPYSQFTVHAEAKGFNHGDQTGELRSNVPLLVNLTLAVESAEQVVTVTEQAPLLETTSAGTHHDIDYEEVAKMPQAPVGRGMSTLLQSVPGMVQDDNGRTHARGSESQVQYVVDGVPITEQMSATFATAISTANMRTTEVITGNVPAEYGDKVGAVVNVNTRSGLEMPWTGTISLSGGSFDMGDIGGDFGGHVGKLGVFVSAGGTRSRRYLDPPSIENFNNLGGTGRIFTRFDWAPTENNNFRLSLSSNGTNFHIANRPEQELLGQNQRQELRDDSESLGWNHVFNPTTVSDVVLYRRSSGARLMDPALTGFPFYAQQNRRQRMEGVRASVSKEVKANSIKVGGEFKRIPLSENFTVAATDPAILDDPSNPVHVFTLANPFVFNQKRAGTLASWFAQDRVRLFGNLTVDLGVRYDRYDIVVSDDAWSPRVGLAYFIKPTGTVLRASYNRLFQTPPTENLLLSSAPEAAALSPLAKGDPVPPERQNYYESGVQQQIGRYLRLDVSHYVKNIQNFSDKDQFLETGIIFPIAIAHGDARGTEFRLDLASVKGFTGFVSYANSKSNGTTPLVGGIFLGEVGSDLLTPGIQFPNDHDQRNTGQFNVTYTSPRSAWIGFGGRYDSGVPTDVDPAELPFLDTRIVESLDAERGRIKPRAIFDISAGYDLFRESKTPMSLQVSVNNVFDSFYLFNFASVFSGTHIGRPREIVGRIVFRFRSEKPNGGGTHGAQP